MNHTPGPWSCESENAVTADFGNVGIAILEPIESFWSGVCNRYPTDDEMAANARLLAAAPDLLNALQALQTWMGDHEIIPSLACRNLCRKAFAKVKGGAT